MGSPFGLGPPPPALSFRLSRLGVRGVSLGLSSGSSALAIPTHAHPGPAMPLGPGCIPSGPPQGPSGLRTSPLISSSCSRKAAGPGVTFGSDATRRRGGLWEILTSKPVFSSVKWDHDGGEVPAPCGAGSCGELLRLNNVLEGDRAPPALPHRAPGLGPGHRLGQDIPSSPEHDHLDRLLAGDLRVLLSTAQSVI